MPAQDTSEIKNKIVSIIGQKGPSLPVAIAREAGLSTLFASAFLSELFGEKRVGMSSMKVGSSSIYFVPGQEFLLENFSNFLKSKEKEAFNLLKNNRVLKDSEQDPAIRVALREIKDFAIFFKNDDEIYWKYFRVSNDEVEKMLKEKKPAEKKGQEILKIKEIQTKISERPVSKKVVHKKASAGKKTPQNGKFLEKVREFLSKSSVEILSVESMGKNEMALRIKEKGDESLLIAFNKKKVTEKEIVRAAKRASELSLRYSIFSLGKLPKKTHDLVAALRGINKIEEIK